MDQDSYELLAAAACGTDRTRRDVVMAYVAERLANRNATLARNPRSNATQIERLTSLADEWSSKAQHLIFDSGFHRRINTGWIAL